MSRHFVGAPEGAGADGRREMIRRLIRLWADLKYWWETRHERAAYSRMFKDRAVRTHPRSTLARTRVTDRDVNG